MKRFIRYLYEYEQGKRMRNVGFVKVEKDEEQCMVHIHGKGFHMGSKGSLEIYLIFEENGECIGVWQGKEDNIDPAINRSFVYTKESVGMPENFEKINGVVLENQNGQRYGAIWDDRAMDISQMRIWMPEEQVQDTDDREVEEVQDKSDREVKEVQDEDGREVEEVQDEDGREVEEVQDGDDREVKLEVMPFLQSESVTFPQNRQEEIHKPRMSWKVRKIQRTELSKLARCEWHLANNNFLLHGYYNYHHLVLLESSEQTMLGVPGIYHEKEGRAAAAFGFAKFVAKDEAGVNLRPEECNEDYPFGYWCRPVKTMSRWQ